MTYYQIALLAGIGAIVLLQGYRALSTGRPVASALVRLPGISDHFSEIALLAIIAAGVMILMGTGLYVAGKTQQSFDPSAYLVVLTLIVGAIKERWLSRSVDRMGQNLAAAPAPEHPPGPPPPADAVEAAHQTADAAVEQAVEIERKADQ